MKPESFKAYWIEYHRDSPPAIMYGDVTDGRGYPCRYIATPFDGTPRSTDQVFTDRADAAKVARSHCLSEARKWQDAARHYA